MREIRIHVDAELAAGAEHTLDARAAGHVARVLRRRPGDGLTLFDGRGREARAVIVEATRRGPVRVRVEAVADVDRESPLRIELVQGLARGERMDWVVQKAVELGVDAIHPVWMQRSEARTAAGAGRVRRWREIVAAACEQSGRTRLPALGEPCPVEDLELRAACRLALQPGARGGLAGRAPGNAVALAVGPEGGLDERDLDALAGLGFEPVAFGPRVLRTETAGVAAIAALQALYGDLGGSAG